MKVFLLNEEQWLVMRFGSLGLGGDYETVEWTGADKAKKWAEGRIRAFDSGAEAGDEKVFWSGEATEATWPPREWKDKRENWRDQCLGPIVPAGGFCASLDAPGQWGCHADAGKEARRECIARLRGVVCGAAPAAA